MKLQIQALCPEARELYAGHGQYHAGDAGLDLFCIHDETIPAGETRFVKLGIKVSAWSDGDQGKSPESVSWLLMPRSSISKTPLRLCNSVGLIDAGYRGEVMAAVSNVKSHEHQVKRGDRIVQAVAFGGGPVTFELVDTLDATARGEGGFGSTTAEGTPAAAAGPESAAAAALAAGPAKALTPASSTKLRILPLCPEAQELYASHGQYHAGDSGLDLFCIRDEIIPAGETRFVKLGIKVSAWSEGGKDRSPESASWLLMPRSSISKTPLRLCNSVGLIDAGYRGEVMAAVDNIKATDHQLKKGDRIVQAVAFGGGPVSFELVAELDQTARGEGGFGSTAASAAAAPAAPERAQPAKARGEGHELLIQPLCEEAGKLYGGHGLYHQGDAGIDLFCVRDETVPAGEMRFIKLGIKASAWEGARNASWLLMPRSSISKTPLRLCNSVGLIDAGYRGEVMAAVDNVKGYDHELKKGDRIVQAVGFSGRPLGFRVVESLDETARGEGGFGSTTVVPTPQGQQEIAAKRPRTAAP